ncbi:MAG: DUF262 domain-containing protein, partial [Proteobacteria bacterium]|nr:DUF262 domain-containing protein [Pseudomonadota bacterium]
MPDIASTCESIESVLTGPVRLTVPYFQRGYAWQEEHAERLLDDLLRHASGLGSIAWYPMGAIILARQPAAEEAEVADGHQRLITLIIILAVLRDLEDAGPRRERLARCILHDDGRVRFATLSTTTELLFRAVQRAGATRLADEDGLELSPSEASIISNRDAIRRRIEALS